MRAKGLEPIPLILETNVLPIKLRSSLPKIQTYTINLMTHVYKKRPKIEKQKRQILPKY